MKVRLVVNQGPHKGKEIPVSSSAKFLIGRASECQLKPNSQAISKRHCSIEVRDGKCYVEDLNSTNGTFINEDQLTGERELHNGDVLKIGPLDFVVKLIVPAPVAVETPTPSPDVPAADVQTLVEKATKKEPSAVVKKPAPKPAAKPAPKPAETSENVDEEDVAAMLLDLDEGGSSKPAPTAAEEEEIAGGSTIMDFLIPQKDSAPAPAPYRPQSAGSKDETKASTSNAAKDILEKYRRRPRA